MNDLTKDFCDKKIYSYQNNPLLINFDGTKSNLYIDIFKVLKKYSLEKELLNETDKV